MHAKMQKRRRAAPYLLSEIFSANVNPAKINPAAITRGQCTPVTTVPGPSAPDACTAHPPGKLAETHLPWTGTVLEQIATKAGPSASSIADAYALCASRSSYVRLHEHHE